MASRIASSSQIFAHRPIEAAVQSCFLFSVSSLHISFLSETERTVPGAFEGNPSQQGCHPAFPLHQNAGHGSRYGRQIQNRGDNEITFHIGHRRSVPHLRHTVKIKAAGRFIEYQQIFPTNHANSYSYSLLLTARKRVWMALPILGKA